MIGQRMVLPDGSTVRLVHFVGTGLKPACAPDLRGVTRLLKTNDVRACTCPLCLKTPACQKAKKETPP